jgi:hypothetical protein
MDDEDGYFGERVAASYDDLSDDMFNPALVDTELRMLPPGQNVVPFHVSPTRWAFDIYDVATQATSSNYITVDGGRGEYRSIPFRYVWPSELDLMAQLAGMRLRDRWEGWTRRPFTSESRQHVSVWEKR